MIVLVPNLCPDAITKLVGVKNRRPHPCVCSFHVKNCNVFKLLLMGFLQKKKLYLAMTYGLTEELALIYRNREREA